MQTWTNEKLLKNLLDANANFRESCNIMLPNYKLQDKVIRCELEINRRLKLSDDECRKIYKNGYDQGRFDEEFERTYKLGRYAEEGKDGLDNPNFEKV
jgi:hypothetical protein